MKYDSSSRVFAALAYLLLLPGALIVMFGRRSDGFAVYHARQSLMISAVGIVVPLVWAIVAWLLAWLVVVGPMIGVVLFALVLAALCLLVVATLMGIVYALQGRVKPLPVVGQLADFIFHPRSRKNQVVIDHRERTSPSDA